MEIKSLEYPSLNVLLLYQSPRKNYRPIIFSHNEIFASADCETEIEGDRIRSIQTPVGEYDIEPIIEQIPPEQKPDLLIVQSDATRRNLPTNLHLLSCPKLLLLGKTNYFDAPIQTLLDYARSQNFDVVISESERHHLHYFKEAGLKSVLWLPGFNVNPYPQLPHPHPTYALCFLGEVGRFHRYRHYIQGRINSGELSINPLDQTSEEAARIYADSLININISLNGDLNRHIFEVLASGGFLLTDKLSQQAGLNLLFQANKHLAFFRDEFELNYQIKRFLTNPETALKIAREGYEEFWNNHRPELNVQRILDYLNGNRIEQIYQIDKEKRSLYLISKESEDLCNRVSIYEYLQELHRNEPRLQGLFWLDVDPGIIGDAVDLPRLALHLIWDSQEETRDDRHLWAECEISEQITFTSSSQLSQLSKVWDFIALTWTKIQSLNLEWLLKTLNFRRLIITDPPSHIQEEDLKKIADHLERFGLIKHRDYPVVYDWKRKSDWGKFLLSQQELYSAVRAFEAALQDNPWDITALLELGTISFKLNYFHEANRLFHKALSLDRRNSLAMEKMVSVLIALNQQEQATGILEHLLTLQPNNSALWSLLDNCYQQTGLEQKALAAYRRSREITEGKSLDPQSVDTLAKSSVQTTPKRILVINNLYPPQELGGYGRRICDFANVLSDRGHSIQVLTSDAPYLGLIESSEEHIDRSLFLCGTYEQLPPEPFEDETEVARILEHNDRVIRAAIQNYLPEVCLIGNIDLLSHQVFTPLLENWIPVMHLLGFPKTGYYPSQTPQSLLYHVGANSEFGKETVLSEGYPLANNLSIVYPGAFIRQFQMCVLPNFDKLRIIFAGLILPYKGPQTLVEALAILHDKGMDFHCSIAGDTPVENVIEHLKNFTEARGMSDKIDFLGYLKRPQLIDLFAKHNILVFPSIWDEPFGRVQVEAMAAGLTLVTSGTGGSAEIIEPGISGLTFPAENAEALAEALSSLIGDRDRWQRIATAGQQRAELFNIDRSVDAIETQFEELLRQRESQEEFLEFQLLKRQAELIETLRLKEINLVIFPQWFQADELIIFQLKQVIQTLANHPNKDLITLLIDTTHGDEESAETTVSTVVMNLFMEDNIDISEGPEIALLGQMNELDWFALLPFFSSRISLNPENQEAITANAADGIPPCTIEQISKMRAVNPDSL
ncbi:glycosyltransferase [Oscillatoria acuminata]|uniref:Glycosyltransferase n=1 Tax=Oscillatoria acuminata PCC 6304 TaxID=56110 RepID=K9TBY7_9CYAN|nr:glycosyltransferase [Oscillatoria acuminata]AFY80055.1 glycosyltransferase [Oscillatoria acuminata PCC 6304]